jgi:hypothetical protein
MYISRGIFDETYLFFKEASKINGIVGIYLNPDGMMRKNRFFYYNELESL